MKYCLGFPYCHVKVDDDKISCRDCWFRMPFKLRSEAMAALRTFPDTALCRKAVARLERALHDKLKAVARRRTTVQENLKRYTIVGR